MIEIAVSLPRLFTEGTGQLQAEFSLDTGSLTALVGPSGSGKTTLLRLIAGLETPQSGRILVNEQTWVDTNLSKYLPPQQRSIGYIFQDTALFPNLTVKGNVAFAAPIHQQALVNELIEETGLTAFKDKKPYTLSGGQRQRVALARALVRKPKLLLLDEPFASLDDEGAGQLREVLLRLHRSWGTTTLLVSHQTADLKTLADRVIRLVQGRIVSDQLTRQLQALEPVQEPINYITFDEVNQHWVIETASTQLRSVQSRWQTAKVGDLLTVNWQHP